MIQTLFSSPRRVFGAIAVVCAAMLAFGILYLQNVVGLDPCPMCIVQRYALIIVGVFCALAAFSKGPGGWRLWGLLAVAMSAFGAFTAARQTWLQWYPPEMATCGRDLYGMIESFPLQRAIPMIFKGGGYGVVGDMVVGILGALLGGFLFGSLGGAVGGGLLGSIVVATLGAVILIVILRLVRRA